MMAMFLSFFYFKGFLHLLCDELLLSFLCCQDIENVKMASNTLTKMKREEMGTTFLFDSGAEHRTTGKTEQVFKHRMTQTWNQNEYFGA